MPSSFAKTTTHNKRSLPMNASILDGAACRDLILEEIAVEVKKLQTPPTLGIILVGSDPRSKVYVTNKMKFAQKAGIVCHLMECAPEVSTASLIKIVQSFNAHPGTHGFIIQLPLPKHVDLEAVVNAIDPAKDVDCFHPVNQGLLLRGAPRFLSATPRGVIELLKRNGHTLAGKHVVVLGRSTIVGRPLAAALLLRGEMGDATVTVAHSQTKDLKRVCCEADVLVVAMGQARFVTAEFVKPGAVVVDVGISKIDGKICGDIDFESVAAVASAITPVPGGVGPMTIAMLLKNTLEAYKRQLAK